MMMKIRNLLVLLLFGLSAGLLSAKSAPFTEQAWSMAQENNELTLVFVHADWCPTCRVQDEILKSYFEMNSGSRIKTLIVNYDNQKKWVTYFKAPRQSTLLLYKGSKQIWFSVAETNKGRIFDALKKAEEAV